MDHLEESPSIQPRVLLLGTPHWGNPTGNYINPQYDDMLAPVRQQQIRECLERLKRSQPTKVALEVPRERDDELNERYREYRAGTFSLTASEAHQLGFRLAAEMEHERIYAIDWHDSQREIGWESAITFARAHNQTRIATSPSDRILVVIGAGHISLLRHFVEGSGLYELETAEPYLG